MPGGYTLEQHWALAATTNLLKKTDYDYVVLQDQSQRPALDSATTAYKFFKYSTMLDSVRRIYSPCGQTMFYMTWGRKNGDANNCSANPNVCTYAGMDSMLNLRYRMAQANVGGLIAPVGAVRNYLRKNNPEIELYDADESHPSPAGSYVSAITFYTCMFKKDPTFTNYNFTIGASVANKIKAAVKTVVFDSLSVWNTYKEGASANIKIELIKPLANDTLILANTFEVEASISVLEGSVDKALFYLNGNLAATKTQAPFKVEMVSELKGKNTLIVTVYDSKGGINFVRSGFVTKEEEQNTVIRNVGTKNIARIFPNPANEQVTIHLSEAAPQSSFKLVNAAGQIVLSGTLTEGNNVVYLNTISKGFYAIQIQNGIDVMQANIIKK
jgi:hypothetical protein